MVEEAVAVVCLFVPMLEFRIRAIVTCLTVAALGQAIECVQRYLARVATDEPAPLLTETEGSLKSYKKLLRKARKGAR